MSMSMFTKLHVEKQTKDDIVESSHKLITNIFGYGLSSKEIGILKLGLQHGVCYSPVESEKILILEDVWEQIKLQKLSKIIHQNSEVSQYCEHLHLTEPM